MKSVFASISLFIIFSFSVSAQDTLTIMTYNLLNYPNLEPTRYNDLKEVIQYTKPDIFICSELTSASGADMILDNAFNVAPINYYARANFVNGTDTDNMLYYNTNKVTLAGQNQITTALRDITRYHLYTCENSDTVWYDVFSLHLKASQGITNANDRLAECVILTNYIGTLPTNTNIIVGGDFNFYSNLASIEPGWNQLTINCPQPLKDPINMAGDWHANVSYKSIHTQSTRSSTNSGCCGGSTGGLDDRFDFLLINTNLRDGVEGAQYIPGTYKVIGNDGNHFNKSIIETPTNTSVPANVNTALFNMSDHLPVLMKVVTCDITIGLENNELSNLKFYFPQENQLIIEATYSQIGKMKVEILNINGELIVEDSFIAPIGNHTFTMDLPTMSAGMYILRLSSATGSITKKFVR